MQKSARGVALANHVHNNMFSAHRGALILGNDLVIFGNDGYSQDEEGRPAREVDTAQAFAAAAIQPALGTRLWAIHRPAGLRPLGMLGIQPHFAPGDPAAPARVAAM